MPFRMSLVVVSFRGFRCRFGMASGRGTRVDVNLDIPARLGHRFAFESCPGPRLYFVTAPLIARIPVSIDHVLQETVHDPMSPEYNCRRTGLRERISLSAQP
jgi:hypothetical protein